MKSKLSPRAREALRYIEDSEFSIVDMTKFSGRVLRNLRRARKIVRHADKGKSYRLV